MGDPRRAIFDTTKEEGGGGYAARQPIYHD